MPPIPVRTADGWTVHLHPVAAPRDDGGPVLLLSPGMMLSGRSLDRPAGHGLASWLAGRGRTVYTLDLRGHGASRPHAAEGGSWTYDEIVAFDVPAAVEAVAARHPGRPLVWIGHSLSAHAGAAAFGQRPDLPVAAAVLLSPVVWIRRHEPSAVVWLYKRTLLALWWSLTRAVGHMPARRLRIGSDDESAAYVAQFVDWARRDAWTSGRRPPGPPHPWSGRVDYLAGLARVRFPVLVIAARGDRWISRPAAVRRFAAALTAAPVSRLELARCDLPALPREPGHMCLVRDPRAVGCWERIDAWIAALALQPS